MHNVEQLKCGLLPFRLVALRAEESAEVAGRLSHIPGGVEELELAKGGIRQPSSAALAVLAEVLAQGSLEELLYGAATEPVAIELETAKAG